MSSINWQLIPEHYHNYIKQVPTDNLTSAFQLHQNTLVSFLEAIPEDKWLYRYAAGKWSIKEAVQHIIDTERIFCYRALTIARKDAVALPGFDENAYAGTSRADRRTKESLIKELAAVQQSTITLFESFDEEMLSTTGVANQKTMYVGGIGFIIVGHSLHHQRIFSERYLA